MKKLVKTVLIIVLSLMVILGVVGCSDKEEPLDTNVDNAQTTEKDTDTEIETEPEEIPVVTWYLRPSEQKDMELVLEEMNKIFREKVGAELEIKRIDPGDYNQRMMTTIAAGETFDMMHSAPRYGFYDHVSKGAYLPLDDLIKEYAPKTYANMPEEFWDAARVNGEIYGIINYQIFGRQNGFLVRKDVYDALNLKDVSIKTLEDFDPILKQMAEIASDDDIIFNLFKDGFFRSALTYHGLDPLENSIGAVRINDDEPIVENSYKSDEFRNYLDIVNKWYEAGYIPKDAPTQTYSRDYIQTGRIMSTWNDYKPGNEAEIEQMFGSEMVYISMETPFINTQNVIGTMTSISRTSENPEKAMQILELVNTDPEVYNLLIYGIEGTHYNKTGDKRIELIPDSGYFPNFAWMVGNQFNAYLLPNQPDDVWERTIAVNEKATVSTTMGFSLDTTPIKNEMAQCQSVLDEYLPGLVTGAIDPDEYLPLMLEKLDGAGVQTIIDEENKQLQEWLSNQ